MAPSRQHRTHPRRTPRARLLETTSGQGRLPIGAVANAIRPTSEDVPDRGHVRRSACAPLVLNRRIPFLPLVIINISVHSASARSHADGGLARAREKRMMTQFTAACQLLERLFLTISIENNVEQLLRTTTMPGLLRRCRTLIIQSISAWRVICFIE